MVERGLLQRGAADTLSKMRWDMLIVEMTTAKQQSNGNAGSIKNVKGGLMQEKKAVHEALEEAVKDQGCNVLTLPMNITTSRYALRFNKGRCRAWTCRKRHVQVAWTLCLTFQDMLTSRRILESS